MAFLVGGTLLRVRPGLGLELGLETCGLGLGLGLDDFRISGLGLGLEERGLGLGLATMGLDYNSEIVITVGNASKLKHVEFTLI